MELILELMPWIWGLIFIVTLVIELKTADMDALWFSIGSLIVLIVSIFNPKLGLVWQLLIFIATTLLLLLTLGKFSKNKIRNKNISLDADTLVGKEITILEDCNEFDKGSGNIDDTVWTVICQSGYSIKKGETGIVVAIDGKKLVVKNKE